LITAANLLGAKYSMFFLVICDLGKYVERESIDALYSSHSYDGETIAKKITNNNSALTPHWPENYRQ